MRFTFDRNTLAREISAAQEIISEKNALSVLSNVSLSAHEGKIVIRATDIKTAFKTSAAAEIDEEGDTTVLCSKFASILQSLPDGDAEFTLDSGATAAVIKSKSKRVRYQLNCTATDKFPEPVNADGLVFFDVPAKDLKQMISQTVYAVSDDITRYFMSGVYFEKKDNKLVLVATDGRRLSYAEKEILPENIDFTPAIVPPKILNIISKRLDEGSVSMAATDKTVFFRTGSYEFSATLVDGKFPNYERVIPKEQKFSAEIAKDELSSALKRISVMTEKTGRITFELTKGSLAVVSKSADYGEARDEIQCGYDGDETRIALNYRHLADVIPNIDGENVKFEFTEALRAVTLKGGSDGFLAVVMPMSAE